MSRVLVLLLLPLLAWAEPGPMPRVIYFDVDGNALPPGATVRLGSTRYRELTATRLHIAADGKTAIASDNDNVRQWDLLTGKLLKAWPLPLDFRGHVSPDGRYALHLVERDHKRDGGLDVWDVFAQKRLHTFALEGINGFVTATLSADAKTIATVDNTPREFRIRLWDMATGKDRVLGAVEHDVASLHFAHGDKRVLVSAPGERFFRGDPMLFAYDTAKETLAYQFKGWLYAIDQTGQAMIASTETGVYQKNTETGEPYKGGRVSVHSKDARFLAYSNKQESAYVTASTASRWYTNPYDMNSGDPNGPLDFVATAAAFTQKPFTAWLVGAGGFHEVYTEMRRSKVSQSPKREDGPLAEPTSFAWSRLPTAFVAAVGKDQNQFDLRTQQAYAGFSVSASYYNRATSYTLSTYQETQTLRKTSPNIPDEKNPASLYLTLSPDRQIVVHRGMQGATNRDKESDVRSQWDTSTATFRTVRLHERHTGAELVALPVDTVGDVGFSPDGQRVVTLEPTCFRVWDAVTGKELLRRDVQQSQRAPTGHAFGRGVAFAPDGKKLAIGNRDTTILIWDIDLPEEVTPALKLDDLGPLWDILAAANAKDAWAAIKRLRSDPERAIPLVCERLQPVRGLPDDVAKQLLKELEDDTFRVREAAMTKALNYGDAVRPTLEAAAKKTTSDDLRERIKKLEAQFTPTMAARGEDLRTLRALAVLQSFPRRQEVRVKLAELAEGLPSARVTQEAQAALDRWK